MTTELEPSNKVTAEELEEPNDLPPEEVIMNYMEKRINDIDETRRKLRIQYPDLLPTAPSFREVTLPERTGKSSGFFMIGLRTFYDRYEWPSCMGDTHSAHHKKNACRPSL